MKMTDYIHAIAHGQGGLRHYSYWFAGMKLRTKRDIAKAISLRMEVMRKVKDYGKKVSVTLTMPNEKEVRA